MQIVKSSGEKELFSQSKFCSSLRDAGAPEDVVKGVCSKVQKEIGPGATTSHIFRLATRYLMRENMTAAAKYNLKNGISQLGPAGFLFEQFLEALLRELGYTVKRNEIMKGKCAPHEVDLLAKKDNTHYIVEAKYHNQTGVKTPLDVVMYADARLLDIATKKKEEEGDGVKHGMWVITNTRFTSTATDYAKCRGIKIMGWDLPEGNSLKKIVEKHNLYPVTTLPAVNKYARAQFAKHDMLLVRDLAPYTPSDLVNKFGIHERVARDIHMQAESLVYGENKK